jgi:hypothetical protein
MSDDAPKPGRKGDQARAERLKMAMRENLRRRKAQARGRAMPAERPAAPQATDGGDDSDMGDA